MHSCSLWSVLFVQKLIRLYVCLIYNNHPLNIATLHHYFLGKYLFCFSFIQLNRRKVITGIHLPQRGNNVSHVPYLSLLSVVLM